MAQETEGLPKFPRIEGVRFTSCPNALGYAASDDGRIWSCLCLGWNDAPDESWKERKPQIRPNGYKTIILRVAGKYIAAAVNRIVYFSFNETADLKLRIVPSNGDKSDTRLNNLTAVGRSERYLRLKDCDTKQEREDWKEKHRGRKKTEEDISESAAKKWLAYDALSSPEERAKSSIRRSKMELAVALSTGECNGTPEEVAEFKSSQKRRRENEKQDRRIAKERAPFVGLSSTEEQYKRDKMQIARKKQRSK